MKSNEKEIKWWFFCETKQTNKKIEGKRFLREKEKDIGQKPGPT